MTLNVITEWHNVDAKIFNDKIVPLNRPAVLRGLINNWPSVKKAKQSDQCIVDYLNQFNQNKIIPILFAPPSINGRFSYQDDLKNYNFKRENHPLKNVLQSLLELSTVEKPNSIAAQGLSLEEHFTGFNSDNQQELIENTEDAKIWIGNKTTTTTHYDHIDNLACVVAGRRKFTLFPPNQISNLYMGPLLSTPAGPPISMVDLENPDFVKYPKFKIALQHSYSVELKAGDAIFIPYMWFHNVESLTPFNALVNYWWSASEFSASIPYQSMLFSMLSIPEIPLEQRKIWREFFDYYVFQIDGKPADHLPDDLEDIISTLSKDKKKQLRDMLFSERN